MKATDRTKICLNCGKIFYNPYGTGLGRWNKREYCSKSCSASVTVSGQHRSIETEFKKGIMGEKHIGWLGDLAKYSGIHKWIDKHWNKTGVCCNCGKVPKQRKDGKSATQWANLDGKYKRSVRSSWKELCVKCHKGYDLNKICLILGVNTT